MSPAGDRLSSLPDELLDHILSLIPDTNFRARTSVLSKRWRHLWSSQPTIFFRLPYSHGLDHPIAVTPAQSRLYIAAVDASLRACRAPFLQTVSIDLPAGLPIKAQRAASRWLSAVAARSIRELHLTSQLHRPAIPKTLFQCQSLTLLDISCCTYCYTFPPSNTFKALTTLSIENTHITDEKLTKLLEGCPVITDLKIGNCPDLTRLWLSDEISPRLRRVELCGAPPTAISVPGLTSLVYVGEIMDILLMDAPYLVDAKLSCLKKSTQSHDEWKSLVLSISAAETLRVSDWFFQFEMLGNLPRGSPCAVFKNLKELHCVINCITNTILCAIAAVLGASSYLEKFCVDLSSGSQGLVHRLLADDRARSKESSSENPLLKVGIPLGHLKAVTLREYLGTINEFRLVEFLLWNSAALETLNVIDFFRHDLGTVQNMFSSVNKVSKKVQIVSDE